MAHPSVGVVDAPQTRYDPGEWHEDRLPSLRRALTITGNLGNGMRVPDDLRDSVCFLRSSWASLPADESPKVGTAFFVAVPVGLPELSDLVVPYLVTAKHCIEHKTAGLADTVELFINRRSGGFEVMPLDPAHWMRHPIADVAVVPFMPDHSIYAYRAFTVADVADGAFVAARKVGAGDDVFVTGLLVHHPGVSRLMPIVRVGNIAAMPPDPVSLPTGPDVVALIEARSIGGLSGSPVFLHLPFWRDAPQGGTLTITSPVEAGSGGEHRLLGVMHGFYPVGANDPDGIAQGHEDLNTGIAVVVLVDRVMDLVNRADQVAARAALKAQFEVQPVATATATPSGPGEFGAFEDLTDKLLRVPKTELDEKLREA